jgi:ATPase subunit of ABC transporter with duplicated ATPase domains
MLKVETLSLIFPHKICFENFSATVDAGERIAIVGKNGSGKSMPLKVIVETDGGVSYVPQIIENFSVLSGGERFNRALSQALSTYPTHALFIDEPTNHLDVTNRKSLSSQAYKILIFESFLTPSKLNYRFLTAN